MARPRPLPSAVLDSSPRTNLWVSSSTLKFKGYVEMFLNSITIIPPFSNAVINTLVFFVVFKQFSEWFGWYINTPIYMFAVSLGAYLLFLLIYWLQNKELPIRKKVVSRV